MITNTKWKYIPEKEREALMRLTMCAREECSMCKFQDDCSFDFQRELATKNMNILADALRKTEPQTDCGTCKHHYGKEHYDIDCERLAFGSECRYEPQTEREGE